MIGSAWDAVKVIEGTPVPHEVSQTVTLQASDAHALAWGFRTCGEKRQAESQTGRRLRQLLEDTEKAMEAQLALNHSLRAALEDAQNRVSEMEKALQSLQVRYNAHTRKASITVTAVGEVQA